MSQLVHPREFTFPAVSGTSKLSFDEKIKESFKGKYYMFIPKMWASNIKVTVDIVPDKKILELPKFTTLFVEGFAKMVDENLKPISLAEAHEDAFFKTYENGALQRHSEIDFTLIKKDVLCNLLLFYCQPVDYDVTVIFSPQSTI